MIWSLMAVGTLCTDPREDATKRPIPLSFKKALSMGAPQGPTFPNTKTQASTSRCSQARPDGLSKRATTVGSSSIPSLRAYECRSVLRATPISFATDRRP